MKPGTVAKCILLLSILSILASSSNAADTPPTTLSHEWARGTAGVTGVLPLQALPGGPQSCAKRVGLLGNNSQFDIPTFLTANGLAVSFESAATIAGGSLDSLDVLYILRDGSSDATLQSAAIESFVSGGGTLVTEFSATDLLFNGTFGFFPAATQDLDFAVPSGTVCGGNTILVTNLVNPVAAGLPATWPCSGDPIGVFRVYAAGTLPAALDIPVRVDVDQNGDGENDPVVGTACIDQGTVVAFFTDFGDFQSLENPRICPANCFRTIEDERLLVNAVCVTGPGCGGNQPPDCSGALASIESLWPPNHKFRAVSVVGVTDPDGDPVTITVTGITQDEPLNTRGDGNTCPDAQVVNGQASVRGERTGTPGIPGNGRVYAISFTASDGNGGSCTDTVYVCVPHDQGNGLSCIDDGQKYNSLGSCTGGAELSPEVVEYGLTVRSNGRQAIVEYSLADQADVNLSVFDLAGRRLATIENAHREAGSHAVTWEPGLPRGLYFYRLRAGSIVMTKTVLIGE